MLFLLSKSDGFWGGGGPDRCSHHVLGGGSRMFVTKEMGGRVRGEGGMGVGVKLMISSATRCHANSHPPSHNISNILDRETRANKNNIHKVYQ